MQSVCIPLRSRPSSFVYRRATSLFRPQNCLQSRRCIHNLRELPYAIEQGLGNFMSPEALRMIAIDYQQGLLTRLNEQVKGTGLEGLSVTDTVISVASHRRHALAFNYASQALNNSFFLDCLRPPPPPPTTNEDRLGSGNLMQTIRMHFGSLADLKSTFSAAAMGMINSGWVWLVSDENGNLEVVATFGAGTLLVRSRRHMRTTEHAILGEPFTSRYPGKNNTTPVETQSNSPTSTSHDALSATSPTSGLSRSAPGFTPPSSSRAFHYPASQDELPNILSNTPMTPSAQALQQGFTRPDDVGDILTPLLCVSVHEHAWVGGGYGVWGKEEYLKQFWTVVDWGQVETAHQKAMMHGR
ncbi:manganese and iron superoxide dismutase [Ramaria rubella]|nr:manganese and iron superoxide dismutase [Ramaria rubella]